LGRLSFNPENLWAGCDRILTSHVQEALKKRHGERVVPLQDVIGIYERAPKDNVQDTPRTIAQKLGKACQANLAIAGTVWRFREGARRTPGTESLGAAGIEGGASVAFAIFLIDVTTGKMLWKANFAETQRSLSENILQFRALLKTGGKWLSAKELARFGVNEVLKKSPI
jgi:hypothetical protein